MGIVEHRDVQTRKTSRHSFPSTSRDLIWYLDFRFWERNERSYNDRLANGMPSSSPLFANPQKTQHPIDIGCLYKSGWRWRWRWRWETVNLDPIGTHSELEEWRTLIVWNLSLPNNLCDNAWEAYLRTRYWV